MIGKTVSHYRIVGSLGAGGMGVVYEGEDVRLERRVALKFVPEELAKDRQALDRLKSEARTASSLNHPNICTIYDVGEYEGQPFIVMELLTGQTLRERMEHAALKIRDVVQLGIEVADALDAAHHRSIIHRDIKPANLFMVERGHVKVLDFGLAKLLSRGTDNANTGSFTRDHTTEGMTLGTVSYMSPEQVTGEDLDGRTDLFSLGVVLYEALTGTQPFTGKTSAVVFSAILTKAPVAPVTLNPDIPPRLQDVVNNCLEKDRELRYQTAADLRADLKRVRRDMESGQSGVFKASASTTSQRARSLSGSNQMAAEGTNPSIGAGSRAASPASGATAGASTQKPSRARMAVALVGAAAVIGVGAWLALTPQSEDTGQPAAEPATATPSPRARIALATASFEARDYRAALRYAEEALRLSPGDDEALRILEGARAILGRFDDAITQAEQRLAAGDVDGATSAFNTARAIDPTAPNLAELSTRIAARSKTPERAGRDAIVPPRPDVRAQAPATTPLPPTPVATAPATDPDGGRGSDAREPAPSQALPAPAVTATPPPPRPVPEPPAASVPAASPRPEPVERTEPAPPRPVESDDAAIRQVIAQYARAIETKDLALYRRVKPNLTPDEQRRIEDGFRAVTSQRVAITVVAIEPRGQEATVRLRRRDTILVGGRQQTSDSVQTLTMARSATGWTIREIGR